MAGRLLKATVALIKTFVSLVSCNFYLMKTLNDNKCFFLRN